MPPVGRAAVPGSSDTAADWLQWWRGIERRITAGQKTDSDPLAPYFATELHDEFRQWEDNRRRRNRQDGSPPTRELLPPVHEVVASALQERSAAHFVLTLAEVPAAAAVWGVVAPGHILVSRQSFSNRELAASLLRRAVVELLGEAR